MRQLFGWWEQNHFCPQSSIEFKTKYLAFVLWITLKFYLILILVSEPEASKIALQVFSCSTNVIQGSPNFGWRLWVFFQAQKRFFWILKKCGTNCNRVTGKVSWRPGDPPPEPKLNGAQVGVGPSWPPTCVLTPPSAPNNCWERTKGCFLWGSWSLTWERVTFIKWIWRGHLQGVGRARHQGGGNWIPNASMSRVPKVRLLFPPRNVLPTP